TDRVESGFSRTSLRRTELQLGFSTDLTQRRTGENGTLWSNLHEAEMTSIAKAPTAAADLPGRAKAVAAIADEHAVIGDRDGQLSAPVVDALHREGLFGMWVPRSVRGGAELDPISSLQVIENLAYGDPSTGWVLMAAALAVGTGAAYLGDEAV